MKRFLVNELVNCVNQEVMIKGWIHRIRGLSEVGLFPILISFIFKR